MIFSRSARALATACLLFPAYSLFSQDHNPLVNSGQVLKEGVGFYDQGEYTKAIALFLSVSPSDTNYAVVQSELALSFLRQKEYAQAIAAGKAAIAAKMNDPHPYGIIGTALDEQGHPEEALQLYGQGLAKYPFEYLLYYNRAVTLIRQHQYEQAVQDLQRSIRINPLHGSSHLHLGKLMARQGQTSHAFLSLLAFLVIEPNSERSNENLVYLEKLANLAPDHQPADFIPSFTNNEAFQEMDALFASKAALQKSYKTQVKFEAGLVRQLQLLFEKMPQVPESSDFWMTYYGPLIQSLRQEKLLAPLTYQILFSSNRKEVHKWVTKNKSQLEKLQAAERKALLTIRDFHTLEEDGQQNRYEGWFHGNYRLSGLGNVQSPDSETRVGPWQHFDENGNLIARGRYSQAGNREGEWQMFYADGTLREKENYNATGELHGPYSSFFDNAQKKTEAHYQNGQAEGEARFYFGCGTLKRKVAFRADKKQGLEQEFFTTGQVARTATYLENEKQGKETHYYLSGALKEEVFYEKDQKHGEYREYYENKKRKTTGAFAQDLAHGTWTHYHPNGKVEATGTMTQGKATGPWIVYFPTGTKSTEKQFDGDGLLTGTFREYDEDGKLHFTMAYEKDLVRAITYYHKAGQVLAETKSGNSTMAVKTYSPEGLVSSEGQYRNGLLHGDWTYFHPNGLLKTTKTYREGKAQGPGMEHHETGELKIKASFLDDELDGYYQEYYSNGQLQREGWYKNGVLQGTWYSYYPNGQREEVAYFLNGNKHGWEDSYTPAGKPFLRTQFEYGTTLVLHGLDSAGTILDQLDFNAGNGAYRMTYPGGKPRTLGTVTCFDYDGPFTFYTATGTKVVERNLRVGYRHGPYKSFHENGQLETESLYHNGVQEGAYREFFASGKRQRTGFFKAGDRDSTWTSYFENGKVDHTGTFRGGDRYGKTSFYDPSGKLLYHKWYNRYGLVEKVETQGPDKQPVTLQLPREATGRVVAYFDNGQVAAEETYKGGVFDGTRTTYHPNGNRRTVDGYAHGELTGLSQEFYANGKLKKEAVFLHGELDGRYRSYREDGSLETETTFVCGYKNGPERHFAPNGKVTKTNLYWNNNLYASK